MLYSPEYYNDSQLETHAGRVLIGTYPEDASELDSEKVEEMV